MTIAAAWVRKVNSCEELVFISDSRLCGGQRWDECPKLATLPGGNCALAFAGDTDYAYPMMMQIRQAMSGYRRIESRAMEISDINGHVLKHVNHLMDSVYDMADPDYVPDTEFIFGGYSWVDKEFKLWTYSYRTHFGKFVKRGKKGRILSSINSNIMVIGDQRERFKQELRDIIWNKYGREIKPEDQICLDLEPFEALCNLLQKAENYETIGGAPQMVKVYQYLNSCPVGVYWPHKTNDYSNRTILGRRLFDYEDTDYWFIDPQTLHTNACHSNLKREE